MKKITNKQLIQTDSQAKKVYAIWSQIKKFCFSSTHPKYEIYGAKGITMHDEWEINFQSFYTWSLKNSYQDGYKLTRINDKKHFTPDNCKWIPENEYLLKHKDYIEINGTTKSISAWAKEYSLSVYMIKKRLEEGITGEDLLKKHQNETPYANTYLQKLLKNDKNAVRIHQIWYDIKRKCYSENHPQYKNYGSVGIKVYEFWKDNFLSFYHWSIEMQF